MVKGKSFAFFALSRSIRHRNYDRKDNTSLTPGQLWASFGIVIAVFAVLGLCLLFEKYYSKVKGYFQRKFSRSPTHENVAAPILVSSDVKKDEDVEVSLESSCVNSNLPPKMIKKNEYESDSNTEGNLDIGKASMNLKDTSLIKLFVY